MSVVQPGTVVLDIDHTNFSHKAHTDPIADLYNNDEYSDEYANGIQEIILFSKSRNL